MSIIKLTIGISIGFLAIISPATAQIVSANSPDLSVFKPACMIKGNISINSRKKLYHLPGMKDYRSTVVTPSKGEKWFCNESEAIAQGWHKAPK